MNIGKCQSVSILPISSLCLIVKMLPIYACSKAILISQMVSIITRQ